MASSASSALHALAAEYGIDAAAVIARPARKAAARPDESYVSASSFDAAEAQIAHKRPHSLAACFVIPHDTVFGNVKTAHAKVSRGQNEPVR